MDGRRIGLMGGTFDPIHMGHLVLAEQVRAELELDGIVFVPAGNPPHKDRGAITDGALRCEMVHRAIADNEEFDIYEYEMDRPGPNYSIDTVRAFKADHPEVSELYFITGADQLMAIETWKDYRALLQEVTFVAATRPGHDLAQMDETIQALTARLGIVIHRIDIPALAISSSDIRGRVRANRSIRYLVPSDVEGFIRMNHLYRD